MEEKKIRDYYEGIHLLQDISIWIIHGFAWLGVYFFLDMYKNEEAELLFGIFWICVIMLAVHLLRHFCQRLPFLLAGHGVFYAIIILFAHETVYLKEERTIFCLLMLTGMLAGSIQEWRTGFGHTIYTFPWYLIPEILIIYFYGIYKTNTDYQTMAFVLVLLFVIGHFWCLYLQGMNDYLDQNMKLEGTPGGRIFQTNTRMILYILLGLLLLIILVGSFQFGRFSGQVGGYIAAFFRMLVLGIQSLMHLLQWWNHGKSTEESTDFDIPSVTSMPDSSGDSNSTGYVAMCLIISLLVFFYLVYRLAKAFDDRDDHEWQRPDYGGYQGINDQVEDIAGGERKRFHLFRTNREKVRYRFKKRVKKTMEGHIPVGDTAWELTRELQKREESHPVGLTQLTELYDVARYGYREISAEEIRKLKGQRHR